jgi:hypothetical protein
MTRMDAETPRQLTIAPVSDKNKPDVIREEAGRLKNMKAVQFFFLDSLFQCFILNSQAVAELVETLFATNCCNSRKNLSFEVLEQCATCG